MFASRDVLCAAAGDVQAHGSDGQHRLSLLSLWGAARSCWPLDVQPHGPGDSEQAASLRVLHEGVAALGRRFAPYVVGDGLYASAPFSMSPAITGSITVTGPSLTPTG